MDFDYSPRLRGSAASCTTFFPSPASGPRAGEVASPKGEPVGVRRLSPSLPPPARSLRSARHLPRSALLAGGGKHESDAAVYTAKRAKKLEALASLWISTILRGSAAPRLRVQRFFPLPRADRERGRWRARRGSRWGCGACRLRCPLRLARYAPLATSPAPLCSREGENMRATPRCTPRSAQKNLRHWRAYGFRLFSAAPRLRGFVYNVFSLSRERTASGGGGEPEGGAGGGAALVAFAAPSGSLATLRSPPPPLRFARGRGKT